LPILFWERNKEAGEEARIEEDEEKFCLEETIEENGAAVASGAPKRTNSLSR
jgi:hypothetical protein